MNDYSAYIEAEAENIKVIRVRDMRNNLIDLIAKWYPTKEGLYSLERNAQWSLANRSVICEHIEWLLEIDSINVHAIAQDPDAVRMLEALTGPNGYAMHQIYRMRGREG